MPAHLVVIQCHTTYSAIRRQRSRLRLDLLGREHPADRRQHGVPVEQLEVAGELLDAVDLAAPLDLDGDRAAQLVAAQQVDRPDRRHVLTAHQRVTHAQQFDVFGEQLLQMRLDAVLHQPGVDPELVAGIVLDVLDGDAQLLARLVLRPPTRAPAPSASSVTQHGGLIQFNGL